MTTAASQVDAQRLLADSIAGRFPDAHGRFGPFGGRYVPETLFPPSSGSSAASGNTCTAGSSRSTTTASCGPGSAGRLR